MPTTPIFGLRYPTSANAANVPQDIQNLAEDVDADLNTINTSLTSVAARATVLETPPIYRAYLASGSLSNNVLTAIGWDTPLYDTHSMHNGGTSIKCVRAGYYNISSGVALSAAVTGRTAIRVQKALAATPTTWTSTFIGRIHPNASSAENNVNCVGTLLLAVNDVVRVVVSQDSGSTQATAHLDYSPTYLDIHWLRA